MLRAVAFDERERQDVGCALDPAVAKVDLGHLLVVHEGQRELRAGVTDLGGVL